MDQMFDKMADVKRETQLTWQPAIELKDTETSVILRAEIPGVKGKDLDVRVSAKAVAIAGEHRYDKKAEDKGFFRTQLRYGKFQRVIPLPVVIRLLAEVGKREKGKGEGDPHFPFPFHL